MRNGIIKWFGLGLSAVVAACSTPNEVSLTQDALRAQTPSGSPFVQALFQEYQAYVSRQTTPLVQWRDANYFARKTLKVGAGEAVQPEEMTAWAVPGPAVPELTAARMRLAGYLADGATERVPAAAAKAQVAFDCWIEQEAQAQTIQAQACRSTFLTHEPMLKKAAPVVAEGPADVKRSFAVNFDTGSSALSDKNLQTLKQVVDSGAKMNAPYIVLNGYTDSVGSVDANMHLAQSRVDAVAAELTKMGVSPAAISARPVGPVAGEGASEANRRVDISIAGPMWDNTWRYGGYAYGGQGWGHYGTRGYAVFFAIGSSQLSADSMERLKMVVQAQKTMKPTSVDVIGFTDRTGSAATNARLARSRAEAVAAELTAQGGMASNVFSRPGMGWEGTGDGMGRRVEIMFHY